MLCLISIIIVCYNFWLYGSNLWLNHDAVQLLPLTTSRRRARNTLIIYKASLKKRCSHMLLIDSWRVSSLMQVTVQRFSINRRRLVPLNIANCGGRSRRRATEHCINLFVRPKLICSSILLPAVTNYQSRQLLRWHGCDVRMPIDGAARPCRAHGHTNPSRQTTRDVSLIDRSINLIGRQEITEVFVWHLNIFTNWR